MTGVFVDTSALYAYLVPEDERHEEARALFESLQAASACCGATQYRLVGRMREDQQDASFNDPVIGSPHVS